MFLIDLTNFTERCTVDPDSFVGPEKYYGLQIMVNVVVNDSIFNKNERTKLDINKKSFNFHYKFAINSVTH